MSVKKRFCTTNLWAVAMAVLLCSSAAVAITTTSQITGVVTDVQGAVVPDANVTVTNAETGVSYQTTTDGRGRYRVFELPPGTYTVRVERQGFRTLINRGVVLLANVPQTVDVELEVGPKVETVTVEEAAAEVEKVSMELGGTVDSDAMVDLPNVNRAYTNFIFTQPGVVGGSDRFGTPSVNGNRSQANNFLLEGVDNNELALNTPLAQPSLDSLDQFRVISGSMNPEFGRNAGSIINAVAKSGTNEFHGRLFYFYRHKSLNSNTFFNNQADVDKADFKRHQWGVTFGGPIIKDKTFFFLSYQGLNAGTPQNVPAQRTFTAAERDADGDGFLDFSAACPRATPSSNCFSDAARFSLQPYFDESGVLQGPFTLYSDLWPNGLIPTSNLHPVAAAIVAGFPQFGISPFPLPNTQGDNYVDSFSTTSKNYQWSLKLDHNWEAGHRLSGYFFQQNSITSQTLAFTAGDIPGFGQNNESFIRRLSVGYIHILSPRMINEFRFGVNRLRFKAVSPQNVVLPSDLGFTAIKPQNPDVASGPVISLGQGWLDWGFSSNGPQPRVSQVFQYVDNFSWARGGHSLKFGFDIRQNQLNNPFNFVHNGFFSFPGGRGLIGESTGVAGLDFLINNAAFYFQASGAVNDARSESIYIYGQDQWRATPTFTLTYGLGFTIERPWRQLFGNGNLALAFEPDQTTSLFNNAPPGLVYPDDPGVNRAIMSTQELFAPRLGFAWAPEWNNPITGGRGRFSIRGGYGIFYNFIEEEPNLQFLLSPPFSLISVRLFSDLVDPFNQRLLGPSPNPFPFAFPQPGSSPDFSLFQPFNIAAIDQDARLPYSQNWHLTLERRLPFESTLRLGYVGSKGTSLFATEELFDDPGRAALATINAAFADASVFQSIGQEKTDRDSIYHSFQATWEKRPTKGLFFLATYTLGKAIDENSSFEDTGLTPRDKDRDRGFSEFDARHRLVLTYLWDIPGPSSGVLGHIAGGWSINGVTTFQSGFPVTIGDGANDCDSIADLSFFGGWCRPDLVGPVVQTDPREGDEVRWFETGGFDDAVVPSPGFQGAALGTTPRNFFHGPGTNNWDVAILKRINIDENRWIQARFEFFNTWNHAQFNNPSGNFNSVNFGRILSTNTIQGANRVIQLALKVFF